MPILVLIAARHPSNPQPTEAMTTNRSILAYHDDDGADAMTTAESVDLIRKVRQDLDFLSPIAREAKVLELLLRVHPDDLRAYLSDA